MKKIIMLAAVTALVGCGAVYKSSSVVPGNSDGTNVRVIPLTAETVVQANSSPFTPRTLPAVFSMTAEGGSVGRGAGALPAPTFERTSRPGTLELRVPPDAQPGPYEIGVGDVVLLATPRNGNTVEELSGLLAAQNSRQGYTVQDDGSINIPKVGRVGLAGLTIDEAEAVLFQRLVANQFDPTFSLEIAEFNSRKVSIGGAVASPAIVPVAMMPIHLGEALTAAGGVTVQDQDSASVRIYRDGSLYQIPLTTLYERPDLLRTRLAHGDAVFVDTNYELDQAQGYFEQQITLIGARQASRNAALAELQAEVSLRRASLEEARSNYQARRDLGADNLDYVYLSGEVGSQSRFALPFERTAKLADALFDTAQGVKVESGDVSQIYVLRASSDPRDFGAVTAWHIDARNAANLALLPRMELRPDDIIFVEQQPITKWNRAISQLVPTLFSAVNAANN